MSRNPEWLLQQLPSGMLNDDFFRRYMSIFQTMADTYLDHIDAIEHGFDPSVAPLPMVGAMGRWIGLDYLDEEIPPAAQRRVVKRYSALVGARGTAKGLQGLLEALTGAPVEVRDSGGIYYNRPAPTETPSHVDISVGSSATPDPVQLDDTDLTRIVRRELPASVTFTMQRAGRTVHPSPESDDD